MARLGRSYPSIHSGLRQASIVNTVPNLFPLPKIITRLVAVQRAAEVSRRRPLSTKLRPPTVVSPALNLSPLPVISKLLYASPRAVQSSMRRPLSTRVRPPNAVNPTPNLFLPTLGQFYHQAVTKSYKQAQRVPDSTGYLNPVKVVTSVPNLFLPTLGAHLNAVARARDRNWYRQGSAKIYQVPALFIPVAPPFLPTVTVKLAAIAVRQTIACRFDYANKLFSAQVVYPAPNLFLPSLGGHLQAVNRARESSRRKPLSTRLSQIPALYFPSPPPFLPTLGGHLQAVNRAREAAKFKGRSKLSPPAIISPTPNLFLPTISVSLQAISSARRVRYKAKLSPPQVVNPIPSLFLPAIKVKLAALAADQVIIRRFRYVTKLLNAPVVNPFVPHHATGASVIFLTDGRIAVRVGSNVYMPL